MSYTVKNLRDVEDLAVKHGFSERQEARFPREDLNAEATGLAHIVVKEGQRQPFAHRHNEAEEIYLVLSGSGRGASVGSIDMATSFHRNARCPHIGLKEGSRDFAEEVGFYPFRGPDASLYAPAA